MPKRQTRQGTSKRISRTSARKQSGEPTTVARNVEDEPPMPPLPACRGEEASSISTTNNEPTTGTGSFKSPASSSSVLQSQKKQPLTEQQEEQHEIQSS
jgi:hypothetical protein